MTNTEPANLAQWFCVVIIIQQLHEVTTQLPYLENPYDKELELNA